MYAYSYIAKLTVIPELKERIKVCAERLEPKTPFTDAGIICTRGFLCSKIGRVIRWLSLKVVVYHGFPKRLKRTPKLYALGMMASEPQKMRVSYIDTKRYKTYKATPGSIEHVKITYRRENLLSI